jgi:hypothetical protein
VFNGQSVHAILPLAALNFDALQAVHTAALPPNVVDVLKTQVRLASPEDSEWPALQVDEQVPPSLFVSVQVMAPLVGAERVSVHSLAPPVPHSVEPVVQVMDEMELVQARPVTSGAPGNEEGMVMGAVLQSPVVEPGSVQSVH